MKLSGNTILITGGTSGIGLELATQLVALDNTVIVTGRSQFKLDTAKRKLPKVVAIQSDASNPVAISTLYSDVVSAFPGLNVLINNAGIMRKINLHTSGSDLGDLTREIEINLDGPIRMTVKFLPQLRRRRQLLSLMSRPDLHSCRWRFHRSIVPRRRRSTPSRSHCGFN